MTVVGGGSAGFLTVFYLCKNYPERQVTWIYPEDNKPIGVGEAIVPYVSNFLKMLGVTPKTIIEKCDGSLKLGIKFRDFKEIGHEFIFPFGEDRLEQAKLLRIIQKEKIPDDIFEYEDVSNHFDVSSLMKYMSDKIETFSNLTIKRKTTKLSDLKDGIIIDCTGFNRSIINDVVDKKDNFFDISDIIPNNQALLLRTDYTNMEDQLKPYTTFKGMKSGWCWHIPMKHKIGIGYVHPAGADVEGEFLEYLSQYHNREININELRKVPMITGRNEKHAVTANKQIIVSIGLSSFFVEPIEATGLYLTVRSIEFLKELIDNQISVDEFNKLFNDDFDDVVGFIEMHYKHSLRNESYWQSYKQSPSGWSGSSAHASALGFMAHKQRNTELFRSSNLFSQESWTYILGGMGQHMPEYDELINSDKLIPTCDLINIEKGHCYYEWMTERRYS